MSATLGGYPCVDPYEFRRACLAQVPPLPLEPWHGRANGFDLSPLGPAPGRGWLLLRGGDLAKLPPAADHDLVFLGTDTARKITLRSIALLGARCVSPGFDGDPDAVHLVQVADRRHHLARSAPISRAFNVSAADGASFLSGTLNSGSEWTWQEVVDELVTELDLFTTQFSLPFTPHAEPENLTYWGWFAWDALNDVLDRIGCAAKYDPEADVFSVVRLGDADATADGILAASLGERTWDAYPTDPARAWRPETVRVRFLRRPRPTDGGDPYYAVDVALEADTSVVAGTFVMLEDDMTAVGATGTPSNSATLTTRADERAQDWLTKRQRFSRPLLKVYRDFIPDVIRNVPGATVGSVALDDRGGPMRTEIKSEPDKRLEEWRALAKLPPWFPAESGDGVSAWKEPVRVMATANVNVSSPGASIDGVALASGDRVGLPAQSTGSQNGIYTWNGSAAAMTRTSDADAGSELVGAVVWVSEGTANGNTIWVCTTDAPITIGATATTWVEWTSNPLTVEEVDGSPSYPGIATLRYDQADGFSLSQPGVGVTRVDMLAASTSQTGVITSALQTLGGSKFVQAASGTRYSGMAAEFTPAPTPNTPSGQTAAFASAPPSGNTYPAYWFSPSNVFAAATIITTAVSDGSNTGEALWIMPGYSQASAFAPKYGGHLISTAKYCYYNPTTGNVHVGADGGFTTADGKTVTVSGGLVTSIV